MIRSEQKKRARRRPILDLRQAPVVQLNADKLLVTFEKHRVGIACGFFSESRMESGAVVDDDSHELKDID